MQRFKFIIILFCTFAFFPLSLQAQTAQSYYEKGRTFMADENWFSAIESFLECVRINPAHAEGTGALAESYYELAEFDQALNWVRKARLLARSNTALANLEVFTLVALGQLDSASSLVAEILKNEPYNRDALFAAGELDIALNKPSQALVRYRDAVRRYPDDRKLLISLALVSLSLGDSETSLRYVNSALENQPDDYRVFFYAAYIYAKNNMIEDAIRYAEKSLYYRPENEPAGLLLADLRYRNSEYEEAIRLCDAAVIRNRQNMSAWYLKGLSLIRMNRSNDAITVLSNALNINEGDEFIRAALYETVIGSTALEDPRRAEWASWHFTRARDFRSRSLSGQALFEYRRGLRLNPFAPDRLEYAELLRLTGFPSRYLEELRFLQDQGIADRSVNDAVEAYSSLLSNALFKQWRINPVEAVERHWKVAVFSLEGQSSFVHADAGAAAASVIKDFFVHDRNIEVINLPLRQAAFSDGFRAAREADADYFMLISVNENERDISIKGELFAARTGSAAGTFNAYRTGADRLRNASRGITEQLSASLPLRGRLLIRRHAQAVINKGKAEGVQPESVLDIVKKGSAQIAHNGIGLVYSDDEIVGKLTITNVDEEIAVGSIERNGFFDRIEAGDEVILQPERTAVPEETAANPELRALLRTLH